MEDTDVERLLEFLQSEVGDSLYGISYYNKDEYTILYKSDFVEYFFEEVAEKSVDGIHEDLRLTTMRATLDSTSYGTHIDCVVFMTEVTIAYQLVLDDQEGVFIAVSADTDVQFPSFVDECIDKLDN